MESSVSFCVKSMTLAGQVYIMSTTQKTMVKFVQFFGKMLQVRTCNPEREVL